MSADNADEVNGPVAMMSGYMAASVGMAAISSRATVILGCA
jgi:hypothetical protein